MNIGIDARMMGTANGGIGRYIFEIVSRVPGLDPQNRYTVICSPGDAARQLHKLPNVRVILSRARHYSVGEQTGFCWQLHKLNLDLVHFPNFNVPIFYKKPFVVTIHDVVHHKISGHKKSHLLHFYAYRKVIEYAAARSRAIITVSEFSKRDIAGIFHLNPGKIAVTYEGPALPAGVSPESVAQTKKSFLLDKPYLMFVGTLERKKNVVQLARGFDLLIQNYGHDVDLAIVGKADRHYPEIPHHIVDIKNKNRIVLTGYVEDEELAALYQGAEAFVSASLHEGFGLPGVEAMKFGLPLVVSNIEVFNEIYDNAAIYFDGTNPADIAEKLHLLLKDPQFKEQLSRNALQRSPLFDWDKTARETVAVYRSCLPG